METSTTTATSDHSTEGRDRHIAREGSVGEQHKCVYGGSGCSENNPRSEGYGQAHSR